MLLHRKAFNEVYECKGKVKHIYQKKNLTYDKKNGKPLNEFIIGDTHRSMYVEIGNMGGEGCVRGRGEGSKGEDTKGTG